MGLYKRNDTWCIQYFANGKRVREAIGPSKRQAELVLAKRKADLREGRYFETRHDSKITVETLLARFLTEHAALHLKPRTHKRYREAVKVLEGHFAGQFLKDVTPEDVHSFMLARKGANVAHATIN